MKLYSRDSVTLKAGQNLLLGSVLGLITLGAVTQSFAGTGNGTMTVDVTTPLLANAKVGTYLVKFLTATTFLVVDPLGRQIGEGLNGTAFADQIKFVTAAGGTAFIAGDTFSFIVAAAALAANGFPYVTQLAPAALDGSQNAAGVLIEDVDAATVSADKGTTMIARFAIASDNGLVWPAGISAGNKAIAVAQLQAAGILVRTGV
jgi:hypothetical protein